MKRIAIALATTAIASTAALASNTAAFSGFHIGAQVGIGLAHGTFSDHAHDGFLDTAAANPAEDYTGTYSGHRSARGFEGGIHGGYDWVNNGKWLVGLAVAGDLSAMHGKVSSTSRPFYHDAAPNAGPAINDGNYTVTLSSRYSQEWSVSAGVRAGQLIGDSFLLYAGLNWAGAEWEGTQTVQVTSFPNATFADGNPTGSQTSRTKKSKFVNGFRPAIGFAKALTDHIVLTGEYSHTWYETVNHRSTFANAALSAHQNQGQNGYDQATNVMSSKYKPEVGTFRLKMSWRLNGMGMGTAPAA